MALLLNIDGENKQISPKNKKDFQISELNNFVGRPIEVAYLHNRQEYLVFNEEGKLKDLPINTEATRIYRKNHSGSMDMIVGNAILCSKNEIK